jgi:hypothetical protein
MAQIGQRTADSILAPAGILSRHSRHQSFQFRGNRWATRILPVFGAVELLGDQFPIPTQDRIRFGDAGDLPEQFASQSLPDFGEGYERAPLHNASTRRSGPNVWRATSTKQHLLSPKIQCHRGRIVRRPDRG